jgi:hypothetical protein
MLGRTPVGGSVAEANRRSLDTSHLKLLHDVAPAGTALNRVGCAPTALTADEREDLRVARRRARVFEQERDIPRGRADR